MRIVIEKSADTVAVRAAGFVADAIRRTPDCVLGLAADRALQPIYRELARRHRDERLDFSRVTVFGLDEYVGVSPDDPRSSRCFLERNLFRHVNLDSSRIHTLDGQSRDLESCGRDYEALLRAVGGINLLLLRIGREGCLGCNAPGSSLAGRTRVKTLTSEAVREAPAVSDGERPAARLAITMGVGTILEAHRCLLVAVGATDAAAVHRAIEGPVTAQATASAFQLHPHVTVVLDEDAASWLTRREYYAEAERAQQRLETGRLAELES